MSFAWPGGARVAVSFSFDDARTSAGERGAPLLAGLGVRATFFVLMEPVRQRADVWRAVAAAGHEIGNHTTSHPCTGSFHWIGRDRALEAWTIERYAADVDRASDEIAAFFGARPASFAYCCGQKYVGRGAATRSTVPVVAERFRVGRGFRDEHLNPPDAVDLAQIAGTDSDDLDAAALLARIDRAAAKGDWIAFAGHDVGERAFQVTGARELETVCRELQRRGDAWIAPIGEVAAWIERQRATS